MQLARAYTGIGQRDKGVVLLERAQEIQRKSQERSAAIAQRVITPAEMKQSLLLPDFKQLIRLRLFDDLPGARRPYHFHTDDVRRRVQAEMDACVRR